MYNKLWQGNSKEPAKPQLYQYGYVCNQAPVAFAAVYGQPLTWNLDRISKCFFMSVPKTCWMIMGRKSRFVSGLKSCKPNITLCHLYYIALSHSINSHAKSCQPMLPPEY